MQTTEGNVIHYGYIENFIECLGEMTHLLLWGNAYELYATNGQIGYVSTERVDGKVILTEGIKLLQMKKS